MLLEVSGSVLLATFPGTIIAYRPEGLCHSLYENHPVPWQKWTCIIEIGAEAWYTDTQQTTTCVPLIKTVQESYHPISRKGSHCMLQFSLPLFIRRWGLALVSIALIIGGLVLGMTSHQVSYQTYLPDPDYQLSSGQQSGNIYINASNEYFAAFHSDFTPAIASSDLDKTAEVAFVARTDTSALGPALNTGTTVVNNAHKIEKLLLFGQDGNIIQTYTTAEYSANPGGFYANNWPLAGTLIIIGLLLAAADLVHPMLAKKRQAHMGIHPNANVAQAQQEMQQPYPQQDATPEPVYQESVPASLYPQEYRPHQAPQE